MLALVDNGRLATAMRLDRPLSSAENIAPRSRSAPLYLNGSLSSHQHLACKRVSWKTISRLSLTHWARCPREERGNTGVLRSPDRSRATCPLPAYVESSAGARALVPCFLGLDNQRQALFPDLHSAVPLPGKNRINNLFLQQKYSLFVLIAKIPCNNSFYSALANSIYQYVSLYTKIFLFICENT
jgi:hypothetical protein